MVSVLEACGGGARYPYPTYVWSPAGEFLIHVSTMAGYERFFFRWLVDPTPQLAIEHDYCIY